jgi:hypothetical protein
MLMLMLGRPWLCVVDGGGNGMRGNCKLWNGKETLICSIKAICAVFKMRCGGSPES